MPKSLTGISWVALAAVLALTAILASMDRPAWAQPGVKEQKMRRARGVLRFPPTGVAMGESAQVLFHSLCQGPGRGQITTWIDGSQVNVPEEFPLGPEEGFALDLFGDAPPVTRRIVFVEVQFACAPQFATVPPFGVAALEVVSTADGHTIRTIRSGFGDDAPDIAF